VRKGKPATTRGALAAHSGYADNTTPGARRPVGSEPPSSAAHQTAHRLRRGEGAAVASIRA